MFALAAQRNVSIDLKYATNAFAAIKTPRGSRLKFREASTLAKKKLIDSVDARALRFVSDHSRDRAAFSLSVSSPMESFNCVEVKMCNRSWLFFF